MNLSTNKIEYKNGKCIMRIMWIGFGCLNYVPFVTLTSKTVVNMEMEARNHYPIEELAALQN